MLIPGSLPAIGEALRVMNGIGWTYVILAEVINARYGLGALITVAGKRSHVDQIFALVHRDPGHRRGHRLHDPLRQRAALLLERRDGRRRHPRSNVLELKNVGEDAS